MERERFTVLAIDDDPGALAVLESVSLAEGHIFHSATGGREGLILLDKFKPDIVLLDVMMPGIDGFRTCLEIKNTESMRRTPVILITALNSREDRIKGFEVGCDDFVSKPLDRLELKARIRSLARTKRLNDNLDSAESIVQALARSVEARDPSTGDHCDRLLRLCRLFGRYLDLPDDQCHILEQAAVLHDIGKIVVPDSILLKRDSLDEAEWSLMRQHPLAGARILAPLRTMADLIPIVRNHHENWDGSGYPDGLSGEDIPYLARVFQVLDAWDALTNSRSYKNRLDADQVRGILEDETNAGKWDPTITKEFFDFLVWTGDIPTERVLSIQHAKEEQC